jgi:hypothetical protein
MHSRDIMHFRDSTSPPLLAPLSEEGIIARDNPDVMACEMVDLAERTQFSRMISKRRNATSDVQTIGSTRSLKLALTAPRGQSAVEAPHGIMNWYWRTRSECRRCSKETSRRRAYV